MDSESKTVLIITAIVNKENIGEMQDYLGSVMQVFGKNGGKPVARFKTVDKLLGDDSPEMMAIIEFPNSEIIKEMIKGDDFNTLSEVRNRVFNKLDMMTGEML